MSVCGKEHFRVLIAIWIASIAKPSVFQALRADTVCVFVRQPQGREGGWDVRHGEKRGGGGAEVWD